MPFPDPPIPLRALFLEDNPDDAALLERELEAAGYAVRAEVVDSRSAFVAQLHPELDVILSDHSLPQFNALQALELVQQRGLDIPFVIVSGVIDEVTAVEAMRRGAADYLLKDRLARLGQAVGQALEARRLRDEQARAHEAVRESEARYRLLAEHATDVICRIAPDGTLLYASPSTKTLLGYEPEELTGRDAFLLVHPEDVAELRHGLSSIQDQLHRPRVTFKARRKDGAHVWIETNSKLVLDGGSGNVREIVTVLRDVTERYRFERELVKAKEAAEESDRLKSAILSNMSHEFRTPLTAILGYAELLEDATPEEVREYATFIREGGQRLHATVSALLDLADFGSKRRQVPLNRVDLRQPIQRAAERFSPLATAHALMYSVECPESPVEVMGDERALEQIASIIIENALKFTPKGGVIVRVRATEAGGEATVEDTGVGIGEEFLPYLFDGFRQESEGHSRQFEGNGVGLAIASQLVNQMGGAISVESLKGSGTRFSVLLPALG